MYPRLIEKGLNIYEVYKYPLSHNAPAQPILETTFFIVLHSCHNKDIKIRKF